MRLRLECLSPPTNMLHIYKNVYVFSSEVELCLHVVKHALSSYSYSGQVTVPVQFIFLCIRSIVWEDKVKICAVLYVHVGLRVCLCGCLM